MAEGRRRSPVVDDERKGLAEPERLLIAGVVEVKSFPTSFARVGRQIEAHVSRLMGGLLLGDTHYPADRLAAARWDREVGWLDGVATADWRQVQRVLRGARFIYS